MADQSWQKIETAPVGTRLMFWWRPVSDDNPHAEAVVIGSLPYPPTGQWWNDQTGAHQDIWHLTHWMGLPEPPEGRGPPKKSVTRE